MKMAYVRVSTKDQNVDRQVNKMLDLGIEERYIFVDHASGKNFERPQYQIMKNFLRPGDLLYLDALDRLGRDYDGIIKEWKNITRELEADVVVLENKELFDSRKFKQMGDMGKLMEDQFLSLLSFVADQERKKILQRQKEGIEAARIKGKAFGRPTINLDTLDKEQQRTLKDYYPLWKNNDITAVKFMKLLGLKRNTFYKIVKQHEESVDREALTV